MTDHQGVEPIAIVGMACRFPGAANVDQFWENLRRGVESVRFFSDQELRDAGIPAELSTRGDYVPAHAAVGDIGAFDAEFFGISPRDAEIMDPQHRLFLECAWEAIEHAGYNADAVGDRFGVVAGAGLNTYLLRNILSRKDVATPENFYSLFVGGDKDFLPTRVSYKLNLRGPSLNVNTACSSSLAAVHLACHQLWSYECEAVLAGAVSLQVPQHSGYVYQPGGIVSRDGHCRAFDEAAAGTVPGSGGGAVVLKRLSDAHAAGDTIHALILGSALNNDGALKAGFTAPGIEGQAAVISEAQALAGVEPDSIGYIEAHGTATSLGDPIEISALNQAFGSATSRATPFCRLGSVKTNIGHLDTAAGIAGLIKTALILKNEAIPASLHFRSPNPRIEFAAGPFQVCTELTSWPRGVKPRRAGVSSFGLGGTNAHVVMEEAPIRDAARSDAAVVRLFPLSARNSEALTVMRSRLADWLETHLYVPLEDISWTLAEGRKRFECGVFYVAPSHADLIAALRSKAGSGANESDAAVTRIGQLWLSGTNVDWRELFAEGRPQRIPLPTYPFQRTRHWIEAASQLTVAQPKTASRDISDWFYVPSWTRSSPMLATTGQKLHGNWLVFARDEPLDQHLLRRLRNDGARVTVVLRGDAFGRSGDTLTIRNTASDYRCLCESLEQSGDQPQRVLYCWNPASAAQGFNSLVWLVQALARQRQTPREIAVVIAGAAEVDGRERLDPNTASITGPLAVVPVEFPGIVCRTIDVEAGLSAAENDRLSEDLIRDLRHPAPAGLTAWRKRSRWTSQFEALHLPVAEGAEPFRAGGTYLITGGLGGIGLILAEEIAKSVRANLVLTSRRALPPANKWEDIAQLVRSHSRIHAVLQELIPRISLAQLETERDLAIRTVADREGLLATGDSLAAAWALDYFSKHGIRFTVGHRLTPQSLYEACHALPEFHRLIDHLVIVLEEDGWLERGPDAITVSKNGGKVPDPRQLHNEACIRYPGMAAQWELLESCVRSYQPALSGQIPAIGVLYPDGGLGLMAKAAQRTEEHSNHRVYRTLLTSILTDLASRASTDRPLRILEVGGGNGIMTMQIAEAIQQLAVEYIFTDIGPTFVRAAENKAQELGYSFMRFATFDITRDPASQGFQAGEFDAVIGLDVIHATPSIRHTTENLRSLLAQGGLLGLVESARTYRWNDMVWGLAEGWWYFEDAELRNPNSPLLSTAGWERSLEGSAYSSVAAFPREQQQRATTDCSLILAQNGTPAEPALDIEDETARTIEALVRIRGLAQSLHVCQADVADETRMEQAVTETEARCGPIHGVIHAAAVENKITIANRTARVEDTEFRPKVDGTVVLNRIFRNRPLDFLVFCSSITGVTGGAGQVGYCAANAFLDAFARQRARETDGLTVSINWGRWQSVGLARHFESWHHSRTGRMLTGGMTASEGFEALRRILCHRIGPQVAVMTEEWRPGRVATPHVAGDDEGVASDAMDPVPDTAKSFTGSSTERQLAGIWRQILGTSQFDRHTSFHELGGDSLVGIQMTIRIKERLGVQLPIDAVFDCPTIADLAMQIDRQTEEGVL